MWQNIDADTDRLEFGSGLEDTAGNAGAMQHQAQGQPADAGADYQNFHGYQPFRDGSNGTIYGAPAKPVHPRRRPPPETETPERHSRRAKFRGNARPPRHSERF